MQTHFSLAQLADPKTAEAEAILRTCVHCGFCTATCPSFVVTRDELDSPRGRIYLIKDMLENDRPADPETTLHLDRCLSCLACTTTCPSGVDYMHLVDHARAHIEATGRRAASDRLMRGLLAQVLPYRNRVRAALLGAYFARPLAPLLARIPAIGPRLAAMLRLGPGKPATRLPTDRAGIFPARGAKKGRVILLQGCVQPALRPEINDAAIRLMTRFGIEVVQVKGEGCCGALVQHMGREEAARTQARRNLKLWWAETAAGGGAGIDAIVITASGCGTPVKDYGHLFARDPEWAEKAAILAGLAKDISEYLVTLDLPPPPAPSGQRVAYHAACSLQHGQKVKEAPKVLLKQAGFAVAEPVDSHLCCGSAGTYNILQSEIADALRVRKLGTLAATGAECIATGNIGCMTQLGDGASVPVFHWIELFERAHAATLSGNAAAQYQK